MLRRTFSANFFDLKVRRDDPQPSIFVRSFSPITIFTLDAKQRPLNDEGTSVYNIRDGILICCLTRWFYRNMEEVFVQENSFTADYPEGKVG
jgi:hypothetical protein